MVISKKRRHIVLNKNYKNKRNNSNQQEYSSIKNNYLFFTIKKKEIITIITNPIIYNIIVPLYKTYSFKTPLKKPTNKRNWFNVIIPPFTLLVIRNYSIYIDKGIKRTKNLIKLP